MGSGHFLVESVDFVTDKLIAFFESPSRTTSVIAGMQRTRESILQRPAGTGDRPRHLDDAVRRQLTERPFRLGRHVLKRHLHFTGVDLNLFWPPSWLRSPSGSTPSPSVHHSSFLDHHHSAPVTA